VNGHARGSRGGAYWATVLPRPLAVVLARVTWSSDAEFSVSMLGRGAGLQGRTMLSPCCLPWWAVLPSLDSVRRKPNLWSGGDDGSHRRSTGSRMLGRAPQLDRSDPMWLIDVVVAARRKPVTWEQVGHLPGPR
jgi:hypothetical protein